MSLKKLDHIFPKKKSDKIELQLTKNLKEILREHYRDSSSAVKWICDKTGVQERAVRNWYDGRNTPRSGHLIILACNYPDVLRMILELSGHSYLIPYVVSSGHSCKPVENSAEKDAGFDENVPINVPIKSWPENINARQKWFLIELHSNVKANADSIAMRWGVAGKTAKRDISNLKKRGLITYAGSRKTGCYKPGA